MRTQSTRNGKYNAQFNKQEGRGGVAEKRETDKEEIEQEKDRELQTNQFNLSSWKNTRTNNQTVCKHLEDNKCQQGFFKYKLCQINLIFFHEKDFVERRKAEDVICLDSNIAFDSHAAFSLTSQKIRSGGKFYSVVPKKKKKGKPQLQLPLIYSLTEKCTY